MPLWKKRRNSADIVRQPRISDENEAYLFRRSRTLTGSLSSSVRAASELSADLQSSRTKHHTLRQKRRKLSGVLVGSVVGIIGIGFLLDQYISGVTTVTTVIPTSERAGYEKTVLEYLDAHPTERFRFSLNTVRLLTVVQQAHPEVASVQIDDGGFFRKSAFTPVLRQPIAAWSLGGKTLFIDQQGVAFETLYTERPALVVEDKTGINPSDAGAVTSVRMLRYIGRVIALIHQGGQIVEKVQLPPNTSRQVDVYVRGRSYPFKTSSDRDPAGQAADVLSALRYIDTERITPKYVDVRVSSKAYYR